MKTYKVPVIAVPHQTEPEIWISRPEEHSLSDGHDLHALLEDRAQAENYVARKEHNYMKVFRLIDACWPQAQSKKKQLRTQTRVEAKAKRQAATEAFIAQNGWINHFRCMLCQAIAHKASLRWRLVAGTESAVCRRCAKSE